MTDNEDKIKVLEEAILLLENDDNYTGICDVIRDACYLLGDENDITENPKFYGIILPEPKYKTTDGRTVFCYPCNDEGKKQRIEIIKEAIKKLQS